MLHIFTVIFVLLLLLICWRYNWDYFLYSISGQIKGYNYRLGDMVRSRDERNLKMGKEFHLREYPDSIASEYMRKTNKSSDLSTLIKIVDKRKKRNVYIGHATIHVRLGDVIDESEKSVDELLKEETKFHNGTVYVKPLSYYDTVTILFI